jgi:hypothetical protein
MASSCPAGRAEMQSFDPQPVSFVPVFDRQCGMAVEAFVIGADVRFDPARFVAQQQVHARRRVRQLRVDRRGERVNQLRPLLIAYPERRAAVLAVMPIGRALTAVDRCIPYPKRGFAYHFKSIGYTHDIDRVPATARALAADRAIAALIRVRRMAVDARSTLTPNRSAGSHRSTSLEASGMPSRIASST